ASWWASTRPGRWRTSRCAPSTPCGRTGAEMRRQQLDIQLKTPEQIELMRGAGLVVAAALDAMRDAVAPGVSTADLDASAEHVIRHNGAVPSCKGYHGFPASICASVNQQVVHGIPGADQILAEGDLISLD